MKNLLVAVETKWQIMGNLRAPLCSHGHLPKGARELRSVTTSINYDRGVVI